MHPHFVFVQLRCVYTELGSHFFLSKILLFSEGFDALATSRADISFA